MEPYDVLAGPVRLYVRDWPGAPSAPVLVLVHGFGTSGRLWAGTVGALAGAARCVAPDLRGWGSSERLGGGHEELGYTVGAMAGDVGRLVEALGIERWALVGHSMGGKAALALAARRPAGLTHLVLVAPSPPTPEPMDEAERERLRDGWSQHDVAEETLRKGSVLGALPPGVRRPVPVAEAIADHERASREAWDAWLDYGSREDVSDLAARVAVPTLVVAGSADAALGADVQARETVARIPNARRETVARAGHFVPLDAPEPLAALVRAHVIGV